MALQETIDMVPVLSVVSMRSHLYELMVSTAELCGAWTEIFYARMILQANHLIIEDDFTIAIT